MRKKFITFLFLLTMIIPVYSVPQMKLSLEECFKEAMEASLPALYAALEEEKEDLDLDSIKIQFLPQISYNIAYNQEFKTYEYLGGGSVPDPIDYYYNFEETYFNVDDDSPTKKMKLEQSLTINQTLLNSNLLYLIDEEKNINIWKELIRSYHIDYMYYLISYEYHMILLLDKEKKDLLDVKEILTRVPSINSGLKVAYDGIRDKNIYIIEEKLIRINRGLTEHRKSLLKILRKPLDTDLRLTTGFPDIKFDKLIDKKKAFENSAALKRLAMDKRRISKDYSRSRFNYLPELYADIKSEVAGGVEVGLFAYFNDSHDFGADLKGSFSPEDYFINYETLGGGQPAGLTPDWNVKDDFTFTLAFTYSPQRILDTKNKRKQFKNDLTRVEYNIQREMDTISFDLEKYIDLLKEHEELISVREKRYKALLTTKEGIDEGVELSSLGDIRYYDEVLQEIIYRRTDLSSATTYLYYYYDLYRSLVKDY